MFRFAILFLLCATLQAQSVFQTMKWRNIGPFRGGRVTAVAGVATQPFVYYQGATGGGVWKTEDAGITWTNISDGYFTTGSVGAIAVAGSDPNIIYVGMGEACLRANISHGDGVYKSADAGKTWNNVGLRDSRHIGKIRVDPKDPNLVYVAALGHAFGPNEERGVFRSKNGGRTWEKVLYINDKTGAVDISMDPANPRTLYAAAWQTLRHPWGIDSVGPGSGLYKSTDGGDHWMALTKGLPKGDKGKIGVAVSPVKSDRVWATVEAEDGGVFVSDDAGQSWRLMNDGFGVRGRQYYYGHIYADTQDLDTMYTFSSKGFFKSVDAGKNYTELRAPHGDYHDLWIDPRNHLRMVNGNDGGATITFNGGRSWSTLDNQPTAQFYEAITDRQFPYRVYGSQQDNTTVSIPSRTSGPGILVTDWYTVGGGESGYIAPDPRNANVVYGGSYFGHMTRYDHRTRESRNISVWPDSPAGRTAGEMKYRFQWTYPIVISPNDPNIIYAGANVLFRSTNEGQSWDIISPDLTRNDKSKQRGGRLEEFYGTIFAIAESPREKGVIWTGSDDGLVHLSRNGATGGGNAWQNVTPAGMPAWSRINIIDASPHSAGTAYLAVNRYQFDDFKPYIYKTADYGKTWRLAVKGIPENTFVRTVREDPKRKGLLYAGTETGVYVSLDDGEVWQSLQSNLPIVPITDLTVKEDDLVAATQGRAFWILDDLTPLHHLTPAVASSPATLFPPRGAYRMGGGRGGVGRRGSPGVGQNPASGVVVNYYLAQKPDRPVSLEFADSKGQVIKTFPAAAVAGINTFEWDLRYPDARGIDGGTSLAFSNLRGPVAPPGKYQVKLTAGSVSQSQSFEIQKNPRLETTQEEYQKQFDLLIAIRDKVNKAHDTVNQIRAVQKLVKDEKMRAELEAILNELVQPRYSGFDDQMLVFPLKLNNRLTALQSYVAGDHAPTDQEYKVFAELSAELDAIVGRFKSQ